MESTGGKPLLFTIDHDGELIVGINDERDDSYTDFILSVEDVQKLREWLGSVPETPANPYVVTEYQRGFEDGFQRAIGTPKTSCEGG